MTKKLTFAFVALLCIAFACTERLAPEPTFNDLLTETCVCMENIDLENNPGGFRQCVDSVTLMGKEVLLKYSYSQLSGSDAVAFYSAKQVLLDSLAQRCVLFNEKGFEVPMLPGYSLSGRTIDVSLGIVLDGVSVTVTDQNGGEFSTTSDKNGAYELLLPISGKVSLAFAKEGYVTKTVFLNFEGLPESERLTLFESIIDMRLFHLVPGFRTTILDEPIGLLAFDSIVNSFTFDVAHTESIQNAIKAEYDRLGIPLHAPSEALGNRNE